ncbi:monoamine oxidase [Afipia massiliensis]|uniref:Tryptophan 2-monooxygenase n=1 Tax=Afipia massiliensis TaxID=211460 RepID=A0A840MW02_9BRAD|nr:NAD(P)/FAD-dependent oxidoreductase [Afipia massiliensis]MBB5052073.1 monoamine oxidase [Afipia massiliensis]
MTLPSEIDVAIIGAGAAGLAAARALETTKLSVLILEARDRIGGRGHTLLLPNDVVFDVGCEWLHSADRNSFVPIARELGLEINETRPRWREQSLNIGFPPEQRDAFLIAMDAFDTRVTEAAELADDTPARQWLEPGNRWNAAIETISTYINGVELDRVSTWDMDAYEDTGVNWRVRRGYGALIAAYGAPCPVALNTKVTLIDHSGARIRIETSRGTLTARQVIVTAPTNLIANQSIRFHPALPDKVAAAAGLPLGLADKVMLALDEPASLPSDGHFYGTTDRIGTGSYHLRPMGQPCISGFFGGAFARELEDVGEGALAAQAIDELVALLGSDYRRKLKPIGESRWAHDPFALGSYSHALPGHADDRTILAAPIDDRVFFAGEATSPNFFSTAHGAQETGVRAAGEVVGGVGPIDIAGS